MLHRKVLTSSIIIALGDGHCLSQVVTQVTHVTLVTQQGHLHDHDWIFLPATDTESPSKE